MRKLLFIFFLIPLLLRAQNNDSLQKYFNKKANTLLIRSNELTNHYKISKDGIYLYKDLASKQKNKHEFYLPYTSLDSCKILIKDEINFDKFYDSKIIKHYKSVLNDTLPNKVLKGLKGKRIFIDPGHMSNNIDDAKIEGKCLIFKADSSIGLTEDIEIIEGNLTLATALLLKEKLVLEGAEVELTRNTSGHSSFNQSFNQWLQSDSSGYWGKTLTESEKKKIFTNYNNRDLVNRCKIINDYNPDLTVIIHFNVNEKNLKWAKPSNKNFNMIFIGGGLNGGDLNIRKNRIEFLRMLITDDIEKSLIVAEFTIKEFENKLLVPTATPNDADYLTDKSITTAIKGVYARNLALTRILHGPLIYGETLYQDDLNECKRLNKKEINVGGVIVPSRLESVADAYFEGIKQYFDK
jgi:N-acetylmuramoyl-L-alanine amidase